MESKLIFRDVVPLMRGANLLVRAVGDQTDERSCTVCLDATKIQKGEIYLAYKGVHHDGHAGIPQAIKRGAAMVIVEDPQALAACHGLPGVVVKSGREAWSWLSAKTWGDPQNDLTILGVTGTNGKTSTVWMIKELLRAMGVPCVAIGTLGAYVGGEHRPTTHTTPDPPELFALLHEAKQRRIVVVAMEVSSHAVEQKKLGPIRLAAAGFTSFSRDHLDFHATMEAYLAAKVRVFSEYLAPQGVAYINTLVAAQIPAQTLPQTTSYYGFEDEFQALSVAAERRLSISLSEESILGCTVSLQWQDKQRAGRVPYFGHPAVANFVLALALSEYVSGNSIPSSLWQKVRPVPGRLEIVARKRAEAPNVFVDYAHTPDALAKTLGLLRPLTKGKLWVVFGCGGDRDRGKRPEMGDVAARLADHVVITSDNPRSEDPRSIVEQIKRGISGTTSVTEQLDREVAIHHAIAHAERDDTVLIAGKGHEAFQTIGTESKAFHDPTVAAAYL